MSLDYIRRPDPVKAIKWTGHNFPDVQQFVRDWIGGDHETGVHNEPDEGWPHERFAYNTVQFTVTLDYGSHEDIEVDPDRWIVVHTEFPVGHPQRVEVADEDAFGTTYQAVTQ